MWSCKSASSSGFAERLPCGARGWVWIMDTVLLADNGDLAGRGALHERVGMARDARRKAPLGGAHRGVVAGRLGPARASRSRRHTRPCASATEAEPARAPWARGGQGSTGSSGSRPAPVAAPHEMPLNEPAPAREISHSTGFLSGTAPAAATGSSGRQHALAIAAAVLFVGLACGPLLDDVGTARHHGGRRLDRTCRSSSCRCATIGRTRNWRSPAWCETR